MKKLIALVCSFILVLSATVFPANSAVEDTPSVSAHSAVLIDLDSKSILFSKNHEEKMGMASTTKIMTALVAAENYDLKRAVRVAPEAVGIEGSSVYLYESEKLTMEELLYALLLQSANDAAAAIAIAVAGSTERFAEMMNERARQMGLVNTSFTNPHGLSDDAHYTTAYDLAVITAHALANETVREIVSTYKKNIPIDSECNPRTLVNHNKLLRLYDGAIGVKTGFTKATGRCLVSAAERDGLTLVAVTLNASDDWNDHIKMLDYGFANYESMLIAEVGSFTYALPVTGGVEDYVTLTNTRELRMTVPRERASLTCRVETFHRFEFAPVMRGREEGYVYYSYGDTAVASSPLICAEAVGRKK